MFNGMVQAQVPELFRPELLSLFPWDSDNTMSEGQRAHHVTLAFKPEDIEEIRRKFAKAVLCFTAERVLVRPDICAVFGKLTNLTSGETLLEDAHITLGGTVAPKESATLLQQHENCWEIAGSVVLTYQEVEF